MNQHNFTVGYFSGPSDRDRFIVMTLTATKALQLVLTGLGPETPSLVFFRDPNGLYRERKVRIDLLFIIKGSRRIFVNLNDAAFSGIGRVRRENEQRCRQYPPKTIF
jgi:hypothetical protein